MSAEQLEPMSTVPRKCSEDDYTPPEREEKSKMEEHVNPASMSPIASVYTFGGGLVDKAKDAAEQVKQTAKESIGQLKEIVKEGDW